MKYHLGCGLNYLNGYFNVDFLPSEHSVANGLTADLYADLLTMNYEENVDEIYSHHVFEHFSFVNAFVLLYKWTNSLKIGGTLIIGVPDLNALAFALSNGDVIKKFKVTRYLYGSHEAKWAYHINGWTEETLKFILEKLGYQVIEVRKEGDETSALPNCSIVAIAILRIRNEKHYLKEILKNYLKLYMNGDCEVGLLQVWEKEFEGKIND
jgi:hypothetical protein